MKNSISFKRIGILISLDFSQKWKNYVWFSTVLLGCVLIMLAPPLFFDTYNNLSQLAQYAAIPLLLLFGSSFYTSTALTDYSGGNKAIFAFMAPASMAEKILCSLSVNLIFLVPFLIFFWLIHYNILYIANEKIPEGASKYSTVSPELAIYISYCYLLLNSAFFVGSIYFARSSYVKSLAFVISGTLVISVVNTSFAKYLAGPHLMLGAVPFAGWSVVLDGTLEVHHVTSANLTYPWQYILPAIMVSGLYAVAYQRLKEKQI